MRQRWTSVGLVAVVLIGGGAVAAHLATAGSTLRTFAAGAFPYALALSGDGRAFVINRTSDPTGLSADGGSVSVVDVRTGTIVHTVRVGPDPRAIALDEPDGRLFVANDDDASISVIDARSARPIRTTAVHSAPRALAVDAAAHRVYLVSAEDGTLGVLDARSGVLLRTVPLGTPGTASAGGAGAFGSGSLRGGSGPALSQSFVPRFGSVAVAALDGRVLVGSGSAITVVNAHTGAVQRVVQLGETLRSLVADPHTGRVFIAGQTTVNLLDTRHSWAVRPLLSGHPSALAIDARRDRLFIADLGATDINDRPLGNGRVTVINATNEAVLHTYTVGMSPNALAVDTRSGHALVVNAGGTIPFNSIASWLPNWLFNLLPFLAPPRSGVRVIPGSVSVLTP